MKKIPALDAGGPVALSWTACVAWHVRPVERCCWQPLRAWLRRASLAAQRVARAERALACLPPRAAYASAAHCSPHTSRPVRTRQQAPRQVLIHLARHFLR